MPARQVDPGSEPVRQLRGLWWLFVGLGVLSIIVGVVVLAKPDNSLRAFAVIAGIFILLDGIVELATAAANRGVANRGLAVLLGVLSLIVGILLIRHPIGGVQAVALFLGIWLIAAGVVRFVMTFDHPGKRLGRFVTAAIEALFGIVIVASPHIGFATLALLVGISFIAYGIAMITSGVLVRTVTRDQRSPRRATASSRRVRTDQ